ncbi:uncharacterized protein LOC135391418 [Ornithodoros turicata]|uniref:uncharacterized protein LOC135391418 n=1 Tax=Ornithodoros turicata TaxID=34597 RepID=UPI00313A3C07
MVFVVRVTFAYIDDILVSSSFLEEHLAHLHLVFTRLADHGIVMNIQKCEFGQSSLEFLGHMVSSDGISPLPAKVEAIVKYPELQSFRQLRRFVGLINLYRRFIPHCAHILCPLEEDPRCSSHGACTLTWTEPARQAFQDIKTSLSNATLLHHPKHKQSQWLTPQELQSALFSSRKSMTSGAP